MQCSPKSAQLARPVSSKWNAPVACLSWCRLLGVDEYEAKLSVRMPHACSHPFSVVLQRRPPAIRALSHVVTGWSQLSPEKQENVPSRPTDDVAPQLWVQKRGKIRGGILRPIRSETWFDFWGHPWELVEKNRVPNICGGTLKSCVLFEFSFCYIAGELFVHKSYLWKIESSAHPTCQTTT